MKVRLARQRDKTAVLALGIEGLNFNGNGLTWIIEDGRLLGCLTLTPVPGLDGVFELAGGVHPDFRRQGVGSLLWTAVRPQLPAFAIKQISHAVTDLAGSAARFLLHHNFFNEHEEWFLNLSPLPASPPTAHPFCSLITLPRAQSIPTFQALYDKSFGDTFWYQPYSQKEVAATLTDAADLLFLQKGGHIIGFVWLQEKMIEPIGIVPEEQGRGYGRFLLQSALYELKNRGAAQAEIGVWRCNETAVRLYQSLGFQRQQTIIYLACNL